MKIKVKRRIHLAYKEGKISRKRKIKFRRIMEKWQYIYSNKLGEISLVQFTTWMYPNPWEIYCLRGNLFDDVMRFCSKKQAEKTIKKYLNPNLINLIKILIRKLIKYVQMFFIVNRQIFRK